MKRPIFTFLPILLGLSMVFGAVKAVQSAAPQAPQAPAGSAFTYQGKLVKNGVPVNGVCAVSLSLWDAASAGSFLNSNTFNAVTVSGGLFTVEVDYGASAFNGQDRWVETAVKCSGDANYVTLSPRTRLNAAPYAVYALKNWALNGNSGTGGNGFVGTSDNSPFSLGANGEAALRIYPQGQSPNLAGGYSGNVISATVYGATIAGGGSFFYENRVMAIYGTVGGGRSNHADGYGSTIAGGIDNQAVNDYTTVAGGNHNIASGSSAGIGGGFYNVASGYVAYIGGGDLNQALSQNATIGGGYSNTISAGQLLANITIGGGVFNRASGFAGTIAGGHGNNAPGEWASMGGGGFNTASNRSTTVSGGEYNRASGSRSTVSGGSYNLAAGSGSTIGGGGFNGSGLFIGNRVYGVAATVAGGYGNTISADGGYGVIGGGQSNHITATLGSNLNIATIGGGYNNRVTLGGATIGGGNSNTAGGFDATVSGGNANTASGRAAAVPGGQNNTAAGSTSFAAGYRAKASANGCFAWADSKNFDFECGLADAFAARATGGFYLVTAVDGVGNPTAGVQVPAGGSGWGVLSDRASKTDIAAIDGRDVLAALARMPIATWRYKTQDASIRHIGPMAQDFQAAFGLGEDEKHINTIDADGVALAAIQGLNTLNEERAAEIAAQAAEIAAQAATIEAQKAQIEALEKRVAALDRQGAGGSAPQAGLRLDLSTLLSAAALIGVAWLAWSRRRGEAQR